LTFVAPAHSKSSPSNSRKNTSNVNNDNNNTNNNTNNNNNNINNNNSPSPQSSSPITVVQTPEKEKGSRIASPSSSPNPTFLTSSQDLSPSRGRLASNEKEDPTPLSKQKSEDKCK